MRNVYTSSTKLLSEEGVVAGDTQTTTTTTTKKKDTELIHECSVSQPIFWTVTMFAPTKIITGSSKLILLKILDGTLMTPPAHQVTQRLRNSS